MVKERIKQGERVGQRPSTCSVEGSQFRVIYYFFKKNSVLVCTSVGDIWRATRKLKGWQVNLLPHTKLNTRQLTKETRFSNFSTPLHSSHQLLLGTGSELLGMQSDILTLCSSCPDRYLYYTLFIDSKIWLGLRICLVTVINCVGQAQGNVHVYSKQPTYYQSRFYHLLSSFISQNLPLFVCCQRITVALLVLPRHQILKSGNNALNFGEIDPQNLGQVRARISIPLINKATVYPSVDGASLRGININPQSSLAKRKGNVMDGSCSRKRGSIYR